MKKYILNKNSEYILFITIILIVIFSILMLLVSVAYYQTKKQTEGEIFLGELDFNINVSSNQVDLVMPGDEVPMSIVVENKVENKTNLVPFYFRFKVLDGQNDYDKKFLKFNQNDYIFKDSFYYYKHKVNAGQSAKLISSIIVPSSLSQNQSELFDLQVFVEAVQSEFGAYKDIFYDAPSEWVEFIENN